MNGTDNVWKPTIDGRYISAIRKSMLDDGMPEVAVQQTVDNAAEVLQYCPDPKSNENFQKTGIVIGKVQSGKTSNFIALTALAFDNGYNLITVFGGTKNILVSQNRTRITEFFQSTQDVFVFDTVDYKDQLKAANIKQFVKRGKKVVIVALKTPAKINFLKDAVYSDTELCDWPTLIIDDEGDEASLNGLVKKKKKTATYKAIEGLKSVLNRHCFVSVTATPQANMLIEAIDVLSPEFGVLISPGKGYCGLDVFHSTEQYTVAISEEENGLLDEGVPDSFIRALSMFFVACAINRFRYDDSSGKLSMLVHPSQYKEDHTRVYKKVMSVIEEWRLYVNNREDISYKYLHDLLNKAYQQYKDDGVYPIPSFGDIETYVLNAIDFCGVHIVNGDHVLNDADRFYDYNIYVGGTMLGRGLTLPGLAITYILRTPKGKSKVDTTEQRARWFGYKEKYLDLCRIFAVPKIISDFMDIRDHEEDLWDNVQQAHLQGTRFKDVERIFTLSDSLEMTRSNVAQTSRFTYSFWNKQKRFQAVPEYIDNNTTILSAFKDKRSADIEAMQFGEGAPYTIINESFETVKNEVLDRFIFPDASVLNKPMVDRLATLMKAKGLSPYVDVIWMRDDPSKPSRHKVNDDGRIPNYSVGRRPADSSNTVIYAGDDNQFKKYDVMQLQIHMIQDTTTGTISPTLALYVPEMIVEKLTNLVIRE